jgi:hypothetical protein
MNLWLRNGSANSASSTQVSYVHTGLSIEPHQTCLRIALARAGRVYRAANGDTPSALIVTLLQAVTHECVLYYSVYFLASYTEKAS